MTIWRVPSTWLLARLSLALALLTLLVGLGAAPTAAHPLGNFSVNRYSRLEVGAERLVVHYVLDMAEIPAFQEASIIDTNRDGQTSAAEASAYAERKATAITRGLRLSVNGTPTPLTATEPTLTFPAGQGGLTTLRLELTLTAPLPAGDTAALVYQDDNEPDRQGWREIVVRAAGGRLLRDASAPTTDRSDALRAYPDDLLTSPLDARSARVNALPAASAPADPATVRAQAERARDAFAALVATESLSLPVLLISLLVAFGLGAAHALAPGHGKAVVAAYLVGARGTARHAVALGITVTITHTIGVFALGLVTLFLSQYILPERLYPWLGATSGLLVIAIGLGLVASRLKGLLAARPTARPALVPVAATLTPVAVASAAGHQPATITAHSHSHDDHHQHDHDHDHDFHPAPDHSRHHHHDHPHPHDHAHNHSAAPGHAHDHDHDHGPSQPRGWLGLGGHHHHHGPGGHTHEMPERITWRGLLALGISGGLLPCPSALVVLLSAIALHRVGFGLLLIVAFSAGLAAVLTGIGLLLVYAGRFFARLPLEGRLARLLPVLSAGLVALAGVAITAQALGEAGLLRL